MSFLMALVVAIVAIGQECECQTSFQDLPNIVVMIADDLGIGDLGCFGNSTLPTPHVDRLCAEGVKLTHHLTAAPLCTPSRAAFMTGRYAARAGLDQGPDGGPIVIVHTHGANGLAPEEFTWADLLTEVGYKTTAVGKWHLGWDLHRCGDNLQGPLGHGFHQFFGLPYTLIDEFEFAGDGFWTFKNAPTNAKNMAVEDWFGILLASFAMFYVFRKSKWLVLYVVTICFLNWFLLEHTTLLNKDQWWRTSNFFWNRFNSLLYNGTSLVEAPLDIENLAENLTDYSVQTIRSSSRGGRPFALYHSFTNVHTPLAVGNRHRGASRSHGSYGDSVIEMDAQVGRILTALDEEGVADNTLVYFLSDHGADTYIGTQGGSNRPYAGGKYMGAYEGGIRVPGIIRWPKKIKPGSVLSMPTSTMDFLPTLLEMMASHHSEHAKNKNKIKVLDGESYFRHLVSPDINSTEVNGRFFRHYCGTDLHALRVSLNGKVWKAWFKRHKLDTEGLCLMARSRCRCFGNQENFMDLRSNPQIIDIETDPKEQHPITSRHPLYGKLETLFIEEYLRSQRDAFPNSQLSLPSKVLPRPWLLPLACP